MNELVSVIIPCFNSGRTLTSAIDSVKNQTYPNIEIIIVNDGSNDPFTIKVLEDLSHDKKIKILEKPNGGLASARNYGIKESTAEFVLPLDADDTLSKNCINEMLILIIKNSPAKCFVFPNIEFNGLRSGFSQRNYNPFVQLVMNQLPYSILFTKETFNSIGGYDESLTEGLEDWEFNLNLIENGHIPISADAATLQYCVNNDGMLLSKTIFKYFDIWKFIKTKHKKLYTLPNLTKSYLIGLKFKLKFKMHVALIVLMFSQILPRRLFNLFLLIWVRLKSTSRSIRPKF